jgi:hypothetical protein
VSTSPGPHNASDARLAASLSRLWPNREHESSAVASLLCRAGIHRWRQLDLTEIAPNRNIRFCFWCSDIKIDGTIYNP